jgi:hypothetical protein
MTRNLYEVYHLHGHKAPTHTQETPGKAHRKISTEGRPALVRFTETTMGTTTAR